MDEQRAQPGRTSVARRGILAGMAAVVAGVLGKASERVAQAANGDTLTAGNIFTETSFFRLTNNFGPVSATVSASTGTAAVFVGTDGSEGVRGFCNGSNGFGFFGLTDVGQGVVGTAGASAQFSTGTGVGGYSGTTTGIGVRGDGLGTQGIGVRGNSGGGPGKPGLIGVLGVTDPSAALVAVPAQAAGVYGLTTGSAAGVVGQSNSGVGMQGSSSGNVGVLGTSTASHGLYGSSTNGYGVYATSTNSSGIVASTNSGNAIQGASNGNVGVLGTSNSSTGGFFSSGTSTGLYATGPAAGYAARFDGPVLVNGSLTVLGSPKSAAVPHPDGSHRRLYCVESPESWFEDFGRDQLVNGRARVRLDPDFDALVRGDDYFVFLTESGDYGGLYVSQRGPHGFEVRARKDGAAGSFDYRVVAKRKDIVGPRLERVDVPAAPQRPTAPMAPPAITPFDPPRIDPNAPTGDRKGR